MANLSNKPPNQRLRETKKWSAKKWPLRKTNWHPKSTGLSGLSRRWFRKQFGISRKKKKEKKKQYNLSPLGNEIYCNAKIFHCFVFQYGVCHRALFLGRSHAQVRKYFEESIHCCCI